MRVAATAGRLVYDLNFTIVAGTAEWKVDLVLGAPAIGAAAPIPPLRIVRTRPSTVQIAIEIKGVMTEHHKAVKNRKRHFEAHHDHVHRYNARAIAGGVMVINGARTFRSPLRSQRTVHAHPERLVKHCVEQMRAVTVRSSTSGTGLDAKAVVVVDFDNENWAAARYVTGNPAPSVGDPLHYDAFIQTVCTQYSERFPLP